MPQLEDYIATGDGFILGMHYKKGDLVSLTSGQAKYELADGKIEVAKKPKAKSAQKGDDK